VNGSFGGVLVTIAAVVSAALVAVGMRWGRGQSLSRRFLIVVPTLMAAAILMSAFAGGLVTLSPAVVKAVGLAVLFAGAAILGWYAVKTWQAEGWSPLVRQCAFGALTAVVSALAVLYFL